MLARYTESFPANADLSAYQFFGMSLNSSGKAILQAALTAPCIGVLQNKPSAANEAAEIGIFGLMKAKIGSGGVTAPAKISCAVGGKFVAVTNDKDRCNGYAVQTAVEDDLGLIFFHPDTWLAV